MTNHIRERIRAHYLADETEVLRTLVASANLSTDDRTIIAGEAAGLVERIRSTTSPTMMESFLSEYGLSTREGVALMCLAEALLRVPDARTIDDLIADKIAPSRWGRHLGGSSSSLVNASTWGLLITGKVISHEEEGLEGVLHGVIRRLGEPVVRTAVARAMKELGRQFVLGRTIDEAMERARTLENRGYTYSYDMLGEAAMTEPDAKRYHLAYSNAISGLAKACIHDDICQNPGISVKFSALHPRYETVKHNRVMDELVARASSLAVLAKSANMGFNVDAEEANRLDISLDVIEAVLSDPALAGWDGFGVVVQAYGKRAAFVIDWLYDLAVRLDRRIMVRLVKGAYWDTEIKVAQTLGLEDYPVFTRKVNTDVSYIAGARKLLGMSDRIYAQFATHNAHTVSAITHLAGDNPHVEFQRLHGMGEALHDTVLKDHGGRCRIYAPVGAHRDLLAYLVRRLLENGANSSFVNRIVDTRVPATDVARDPFDAITIDGDHTVLAANPNIAPPPALYGEDRVNAKGWDILDPVHLDEIDRDRSLFKTRQWHARPLIAGDVVGGEEQSCTNPANPDDIVGTCIEAAPEDVKTALGAAEGGFHTWSATPVEVRGAMIRRIGDLYEKHAEEFFALAAREAGKTLPDCVGEVREAVDFLRYYPNEVERLADQARPRGVFVCVSPWNFPLAIFTGQIAAALAAGNAVIAKPAEQTPLMAARAVGLMHEAGVPVAALQLLPGSGPAVGEPLIRDRRITGVCFTGSTATAQRINRVMADHMAPEAPLLAETGGLNAMIVDSTALPEQAVRDIITSSFQSAGQRCSALRVLYLQEDIRDRFLEMLFGAMDQLAVGDPWNPAIDVGPVISSLAKQKIDNHIRNFEDNGQCLKKLAVPENGTFVSPTVLKVNSIADLDEEIFGPVLHVATFKAHAIDSVIDAINGTGYGLTFGLHTRVDSRVQQIIDRIRVGNIYVNRNQIGAIVGSQPFGGEGLSGTGPKAGGPQYVQRFMKRREDRSSLSPSGDIVDEDTLQKAIDGLSLGAWSEREDRRKTNGLSELGDETAQDLETLSMPGPTGESNQLSTCPRGVVLCLGPDPLTARMQAIQALSVGNGAVVVIADMADELTALKDTGAPLALIKGQVPPQALSRISGIDAVASAADGEILSEQRRALANRDGVLIPLITERNAPERYVLERHVCIDTTASGGNASLLSLSDG